MDRLQPILIHTTHYVGLHHDSDDIKEVVVSMLGVLYSLEAGGIKYFFISLLSPL